LTCRCGRQYASFTDSAGMGTFKPSPIPPPLGGPGAELTVLFKQLGIKPNKSCGCAARAAEMDRWGTAGCEENRGKILGWMQEAYSTLTRAETLATAAKLANQTWPLGWFNPLDPFGSILDEAIRRAAAKLLTAPVRHLVYHVGPFAANSVWRWNVAELLKRIDLFNGKRAVAIITGEGMESPEEVRRAFAGHVEHFETFQNDPKLREVVSFHWLMEQVVSASQNDITFFAHAKGVTRPLDSPCVRWAEIQYETCLDYMHLAERLLVSFPIVGSFKRVGSKFFMPSKSAWHYSGTFFWMRNSQTFTRDWRTIDRKLYGVESWPGIHFKTSEGGLLFHEHPDMNLYDAEYMKKVEVEYAQWRTYFAKERTNG